MQNQQQPRMPSTALSNQPPQDSQKTFQYTGYSYAWKANSSKYLTNVLVKGNPRNCQQFNQCAHWRREKLTLNLKVVGSRLMMEDCFFVVVFVVVVFSSSRCTTCPHARTLSLGILGMQRKDQESKKTNTFLKPRASSTASCRASDRLANKNHSLLRGTRGQSAGCPLIGWLQVSCAFTVIWFGKNRPVTGYEENAGPEGEHTEKDGTGLELDSTVPRCSHLLGFSQRGRNTGAQLPQEVLWEAAACQVGLDLDERHGGSDVLISLEQRSQEKCREVARSDTVNFLLVWRQNTRTVIQY